MIKHPQANQNPENFVQIKLALMMVPLKNPISSHSL
jgi:hypothetical protein